nr:immunoglobulin heavy chain junction region [Macaca mulatta]
CARDLGYGIYYLDYW